MNAWKIHMQDTANALPLVLMYEAESFNEAMALARELAAHYSMLTMTIREQTKASWEFQSVARIAEYPE